MRKDSVGFIGFCVVTVVVIGMIVAMVHDSVKLTEIQAQMLIRRAVRDAQIADLHKIIDEDIRVRVDHRYKDTDAEKDFACLPFVLSGCSGVSYLGNVGSTKFYSVNSSKVDGPNFNALVSEKGDKVTIENVANGPGIASSVVAPLITSGGQVGASTLAPPSHGSTINVAK
jgi:hypothetical protein